MKNRIKITTFLLVLILLLTAVFGGTSVFAANSTYQKVADLNGKVIGVQTSTLYEEEIMDRCPDSKIMYFTMPPDMINALKGGKVDAYLIEEAGYYEHYKNHPELTVVPENGGDCRGTVAISGKDKQKEARLLFELNEFIAKHKEDGMLDEMYDYWIKGFDANTSVCKEVTYTGENGELRVGVEGAYEPFSFVSFGKDSGFDVDFVQRFCAEYGYIPKFDRVAFEQIAPGVETGTYDLGMNIILSDERDDAVTLTDVYYECGIFLVVLDDEYVSTTNFIESIKNNFHNTFIKEDRWKMFAQGAGLTTLITLASILFGTLFGFLLYIACRKGNKIANGFASVYNWLIDGMPTVVLLMILYYIVFGSTRVSATIVSIIGFTLIFTSSMFDMLSVGFNAVGKGQVEAACALGYSDSQSFFKILLPQAAHHFLPIAENEVVTLIKETSVAGYITVMELTKISDLVRSRTYQAFFALISTAIIYFLISGILTRLIRVLEKKIDPKRRSKDKILEGVVIEE
ncbi:MAG: ABC transporter substrate-binding protein/permease [Clostridia bacterium]|nr:ABC transporter substrate-binding protein/permease [Clostridia bacterium]